MTAYFPPPRQFAELLRAALHVIEADNYADDANAHADADSEYAAEKLALAARGLVRAVDKLPEGQQPIGWVEQPDGGIRARDLVQSLGLLDGCAVTPVGFPTPAQIDTNNTED